MTELHIYETPAAGALLKGNPYVGRGIVIGMTPDGKNAVCAYFIMGRSANSRNRIFSVRDGAVYTEPFDVTRVEDPSLIIYAAVRSIKNHLIVTNGDQTDTVYEYLEAGKRFEDALETREFEPDAPNFTPRISGLLTFEDGSFRYRMSILKSVDEAGTACARHTFSYPAVRGLGHFLHTYVTDGNPIPTFQGEPERLTVPDDIDSLTEELWNNLDPDNKISLYVRYTDLENGSIQERLINKNQN